MPPERLFLWIIFNIFVLGMLTVDLGVFHRKAHAVTTRKPRVGALSGLRWQFCLTPGSTSGWDRKRHLSFLPDT
jgi:tellurite resistance protein TerC